MENNRSIINTTAILGTIGCVVLLYLLVAVALWGVGRKEVVRCSQFKTQPEAQATFSTDNIKYEKLDSNHDGIACSALPKQ